NPDRPPTRVLVFLKGGIGDVVFALPLLGDLRAGFPRAELVALSHDQGADVLRYAPAVDTVRSTGPMSARTSVRDGLVALGPERFDLALTPVRSVRAAWLLLRSGASTRVGFDGGPERLLLTHAAPVRPFEVVFSRRFERLASALGLPTGAPARLAVPAPLRDEARRRLASAGRDEGRPLVALHVGGGWPTKRWPVAHARALVERLAARGHQILLLGGQADRGAAQEIALAAPGSVVDRAGASVADTVAELSLATVAVGLDSGLSHAGVALGVPTVLLFGPNDPASVQPVPHARLVTQPLPCRPCNRAGKLRCPEGHHRCMRDTTPEQVLAALDALATLRVR
ncbi:MAG TPA: glycosyltransferase family 9 protein, partial [Myxococcaceae bacterium]|nr:glycosyltransferase family 9 protein [Myxococcaceae bacterium]